jgi:hypothetical protein
MGKAGAELPHSKVVVSFALFLNIILSHAEVLPIPRSNDKMSS